MEQRGAESIFVISGLTETYIVGAQEEGEQGVGEEGKQGEGRRADSTREDGVG